MDMETTMNDNFSVPIDQSVIDRLPDFDDLDCSSDCDSVAEYSFGDGDLDTAVRRSSGSFSVPIDQSVLDRLPGLDDFDDADDDSEAEYSYGDADSLSLNEDGDSVVSEDDVAATSSLFTIVEETEEDLMSQCSCEDDDMDDDLYSDCIQTPRRTQSLDAYLAKDERRHQADNLDVTFHPMMDEGSDSSDDSDILLTDQTTLRKYESECSFASTDDDSKASDTSSTSSGSSPISFRLAQRKLQKELSLIKLKQAMENAELTSSFRKDDVTSSKHIDSIQQTLLDQMAENSQARTNLLSAISSSKVSVRKE